MPAYIIASVKVTDPQKYQQYTALTPPALKAAGARMIARGAAEVLEGDWPAARIVIMEFADEAAARGFYNSELYQQASRARDGATEFFNAILVPGA